MKEKYYLVLPVEKTCVLNDKDLEEVNFHGGVNSFKAIVSRMVQLRFKTANSNIEIDSISWNPASKNDVLFVKFTQTYYYDHDSVYDAVVNYVKQQGFDDISISIARNDSSDKFIVRININDVLNLRKTNLRSIDLVKVIKAVEPDMPVDVKLSCGALIR